MTDLTILGGLLLAYIDGDVLARKALLDFLEEESDARMETVRAENLDWDALAKELAESSQAPAPYDYEYLRGTSVSRHRWMIDCARYGSTVMPYVAQGVREARRAWLRQLFPEIPLQK
jgi:hypothetical protein